MPNILWLPGPVILTHIPSRDPPQPIPSIFEGFRWCQWRQVGTPAWIAWATWIHAHALEMDRTMDHGPWIDPTSSLFFRGDKWCEFSWRGTWPISEKHNIWDHPRDRVADRHLRCPFSGVVCLACFDGDDRKVCLLTNNFANYGTSEAFSPLLPGFKESHEDPEPSDDSNTLTS